MDFDKMHGLKVGILFVFFCILAYLLWSYDIGYPILPVLVLSGIVWFVYEYKFAKKVKAKELNSAFEIGMFLMIFDFAVENIGALLGLWQVTKTAFHVIFVPIEIMALCLIGGTAWALAQPKRFMVINSALDILLFSTFGMIGEFLLIKNGVMAYSGWWTSAFAFLGYLITWISLHFLRYRVVGPKPGS